MENICWPYFDPEYENLSQRIHPPMVSVDNDTCEDCSLVKVDSANRHGILLEVVQVLTDLDLTISKAYISSDGGWFMDGKILLHVHYQRYDIPDYIFCHLPNLSLSSFIVFHVTDQLGHKITDQRIIEYIQHALGAKQGGSISEVKTCLGRTVGVQSIGEHTAIELTGTDRPGLLSEISAVLTNLKCNVVAAEIWTHNMRVACVVYVTDEATCAPIEDPERLVSIKEQLSNVLKGNDNDDRRGVKTDFSMGLTHTERRLHQMMYADRDYDALASSCSPSSSSGSSTCLRPVIKIENCNEKGYSVVSVHCKDRPKLLFDTVCTLTDMQYVVFHATITSSGTFALQVPLLTLQEYYIRHMDGCTLDTEGEKQRVIKCLEAAIERRVSEGIRLELCTRDRVGLLSDITRIFRENGLSVMRADVATRGDKAVNVFYVADASGNPVDMKIIEAMRKEIGHTILQVKNASASPRPIAIPDDQTDKPRVSFGTMLRSQLERFTYNLGLIKS